MTSIQNSLSILGERNHFLSAEIARLPDLAGKPDRTPCQGLTTLMEAYFSRTEAFESLFAKIYRIGRIGHRKYCTPLQAVYWLAKEGRIEQFFNQPAEGKARPDDSRRPNQTRGGLPVLDRLLDWAWFEEPVFFSDRDIRRIIGGIQAPPVMADYRRLRIRRTSNQLQRYILEDFQDRPGLFDSGDHGYIGKALAQTRWQKFETVRDRLNAPELLHYYLTNRMTYTQTPARGTYRTFRSGRGQCTDAAYFSRDMLARSGYQTFVRSVRWNANPWTGLHTGAGVIDQNGKYLLVANFNGVNKFSGPYGRIEQVDRCLARGNRIIDQRWGAYFPPQAE